MKQSKKLKKDIEQFEAEYKGNNLLFKNKIKDTDSVLKNDMRLFFQ